MSLSLDIKASSVWRRLPRARTLARETIAACVAECGFEARDGVEVSLLLTSDEELKALNARWRGQDKPTNVLSFPAPPADRLGEAGVLGDIALAFETLAYEAEAAGIPFADHYCHLVAHGFLHLIGYDHQTDDKAERMEALEKRILARLGVANPYADGAVTEKK
jgi:probable rRNA maturation factor